MEGIGAAEIVLVHRQELRDTLISEQPSDRLQLGLAGSGLSAAGLGLVRWIAGWVAWLPASRARVGGAGRAFGSLGIDP